MEPKPSVWFPARVAGSRGAFSIRHAGRGSPDGEALPIPFLPESRLLAFHAVVNARPSATDRDLRLRCRENVPVAKLVGRVEEQVRAEAPARERKPGLIEDVLRIAGPSRWPDAGTIAEPFDLCREESVSDFALVEVRSKPWRASLQGPAQSCARGKPLQLVEPVAEIQPELRERSSAPSDGAGGPGAAEPQMGALSGHGYSPGVP